MDSQGSTEKKGKILEVDHKKDSTVDPNEVEKLDQISYELKNSVNLRRVFDDHRFFENTTNREFNKKYESQIA